MHRVNDTPIERRWVLLGLLLIVAVAFSVSAMVIPTWQYPQYDKRQLDELKIEGKDRLSAQEARLKLQSDARVSYLQMIGATAALAGVVSGALVAWRQLRQSSQSSTDQRHSESNSLILNQYSKAIEHLGSDSPDIRVAGIYALQMVAEASQTYREAVSETLSAFVRTNCPWPPSKSRPAINQLEEMSELRSYAPDVQAAMTVLGKHTYTWWGAEGLRFRQTDLRRANLRGGHFEDCKFTESHMERAWLRSARFDGASFRGASLVGADLTSAVLDGANIRGAVFKSATLTDISLHGAVFDSSTVWPSGFSDNIAAGLGATRCPKTAPPTSVSPLTAIDAI